MPLPRVAVINSEAKLLPLAWLQRPDGIQLWGYKWGYIGKRHLRIASIRTGIRRSFNRRQPISLSWIVSRRLKARLSPRQAGFSLSRTLPNGFVHTATLAVSLTVQTCPPPAIPPNGADTMFRAAHTAVQKTFAHIQ